MKLLTFHKNNKLILGVKTSNGVLDVVAALESIPVEDKLPKTFEEVLQFGNESVRKLDSYINEFIGKFKDDVFQAEEEINFGPCIPNPSKIICVGLNYRKHAEESNMHVPEYPILFNKFNNTLAAHNNTILLPNKASQVDYEAELGIVIGKKAKYVEREEALSYVLGYCNVNDLSARDLQFRTNQWLLGKCLDGFSPVGPYIVTADEVGNPNELGIRCIVNGELRQNSNTADMIFHCDEIISYISQYMTLEPGDIILTGTPEGVVIGYPENQREWLKDGDEVTIEIDELGSLTNRMKQE